MAANVTKATTQDKTFVGLSGVYCVLGGIPDSGDINETQAMPAGGYVTGDCIQVPVRRDGGFTYTGGTPSVERFNIHGMVGAYTARITQVIRRLTSRFQPIRLRFCSSVVSRLRM